MRPQQLTDIRDDLVLLNRRLEVVLMQGIMRAQNPEEVRILCMSQGIVNGWLLQIDYADSTALIP